MGSRRVEKDKLSVPYPRVLDGIKVGKRGNQLQHVFFLSLLSGYHDVSCSATPFPPKWNEPSETMNQNISSLKLFMRSIFSKQCKVKYI
jgi:hypothetical protein